MTRDEITPAFTEIERIAFEKWQREIYLAVMGEEMPEECFARNETDDQYLEYWMHCTALGWWERATTEIEKRQVDDYYW